MAHILTSPFAIDHLRHLKIAERHQKVREMALYDYDIQKQMVAGLSVTFMEPKTLTLLGCFGVFDGTLECWAFLRHDILERDYWKYQRYAMVRECNRILTQREVDIDKPCFARVDGTQAKDLKFIETIGFKPSGGEWYQRGVDESARGQQLDIFA